METSQEQTLKLSGKEKKSFKSFLLARRREARKRQKLRQKNSERGSGSADATEMFNDENLLANPEEEKPEPPAEFDEDAVKQKVCQCVYLSASLNPSLCL